MQNIQPEVSINARGYDSERRKEATEYAQKMPLTHNMSADVHINKLSKEITSLNNVSKSATASNQFRNGVDGKSSLDYNSSPSNDSLSQFASRNVAIKQKELGFINDLVKLGLPKDHMNGNQNINNSFPIQSNSPQANPIEFSAVKTDSLIDRNIYDGHESYASVATGSNQIRYQTSSQPNVNGLQHEHSRNRLLEDTASLYKDLNTRSKNDKTVKQEKNIDNELTLDRPLFSTSPLTHHEEHDRKHSARRQREQRHQTSFKPGSPKFIHPSSRHGVLSDDEYIINASSAGHLHGRRSAPIFTKRGFSASEFWNSGQTAIERTHMQDMANSRILERQKAKSPNVFNKFPSLSQNLRRPRSADPSSLANKSKNNNLEIETVQSGIASQSGGKGFFVNYGSRDDTASHIDTRGYHSELDTTDRRLWDSSAFSNRLQPSSWNADDGFSSILGIGAKNERPLPESSETVQSRGMRGVFHTPRVITPRDLEVMVTQGKDTAKMSKTAYGYIPENAAAVSQKESSASSSDEADDGRKDKKIVLLKDMPVDSSDDTIAAKTETKTEVYSRRWYLLFLFSVTAMLWNAIWSTWGPIAQSAKGVYNWNDGDIAMFTYLGNIPFLITMFPCAYLMDVSGMRIAMIFCCGFMFVGAGFRCLPGDTYTSTWFIRVGQWLNGMAGTIPSSGPALLSGLWFPPHQRATATAISTVAGYMGASISFVIGPLLVPEPNDLSPVNNTNELLSDDYDTNSSSNATINYSAQEQGIKNILYSECGLAGLLFFLVIIYFPSKPPLPPSISASIPREKYLNGLKMLVRSKQFWICAIAFSVPIGVYESWQVILDINLDSRGITQETAGWLDFYATLGGCVSGLLVSRFADLFTRQMKLFLLVFYSFATVAILWLTLVVLDIIPFDEVSIFAAIIITGVFLDGGSPLFFELTIEVSYPVGEGVTSGFMHMLCAAAGTIFLVMVQIENIGTEWMNWCFLGCVGSTIPLLLFINTTYSRADIDDMEMDVSDEEEEEEEAMMGISAAENNEKTPLLKNSTV